jgi:predicted small metal-binding protein
MRYVLRHKDVDELGDPDCPFVTNGRDKDELVKTMMDHIENDHPDEYRKALKKMSPEEMEKKIEESVEEEDEDLDDEEEENGDESGNGDNDEEEEA